MARCRRRRRRHNILIRSQLPQLAAGPSPARPLPLPRSSSIMLHMTRDIRG